MWRRVAGFALGAGLALAPFAPALAASEGLLLRVETTDGAELAALPVAEGDGWCLYWHHSVAGFEVQDCFAARSGGMELVSSRQPDFAAGLGHVPGRGEMTSTADGGYLIENIDEPIPGNCLPLRLGSLAVNHRLVIGDKDISLSVLAERERVRILLEGEGSEGATKC